MKPTLLVGRDEAPRYTCRPRRPQTHGPAGQRPCARAIKPREAHSAEGNRLTQGITDKKTIAELTAKMFIEVEAVRFNTEKPFIFTSGWASPVYLDCRRLISFPRVRRALMDFGAATVQRDAGFECFDVVAGGETAGIPFAAWMADRLMLPMQYVRKQPKGFGRNAQIEGAVVEGQRTLLVEDMTTDGRSKVNFCNALRKAGAKVEHIFVLFYYDIFPTAPATFVEMGVKLHALATWWYGLAAARQNAYFTPATLEEVEKFMRDPAAWSKAHGGVEKVGD